MSKDFSQAAQLNHALRFYNSLSGTLAKLQLAKRRKRERKDKKPKNN